MRLDGYRLDGTLRVQIPGGMTVLMRGDDASPPIDDKDADALGPWLDPGVSLSELERQQLGKQLDRARTMPLRAFALKFPFQKKKSEDAEPAGEAATEVAAPTAEKPLTKGDLLARITEIAQAREKEKADAAAAPKGPKSTLKRLKLEYETDERDGEEKKPVSEVAQADAKPAMNFGGAGSGNFGHAGRPGEIGGSGEGGVGGSDTMASKYWSKFPDAHQNAFAARVLAATSGGADISAVTTAKPTSTGIRFKTIDGHAAGAIGRVADRAGHRNTHRYDNQTGHYIVHVSTATKK